jgi:hypothetical protein
MRIGPEATAEYTLIDKMERRLPPRPSSKGVYNPAALWQDNAFKIISLYELMKRLISEYTFEFLTRLVAYDEALQKRNRQSGERAELIGRQEAEDMERLINDIDRAFAPQYLGASLQALLDLYRSAQSQRTTLYQFAMNFAAFRKLLEDDLRSVLLLVVEPAKRPFYESVEPFGPEVEAAFPSAKSELIEACNCYALDRNDACVFHLMRALEKPLLALCAELHIDCEGEPWGRIIERIEKAIGEFAKRPRKDEPRKIDKLQFYSEAAKEFRYFKDAWRNCTAHQSERESFTEKDAARIMGHVRDFMQRLSKRLSEPKD